MNELGMSDDAHVTTRLRGWLQGPAVLPLDEAYLCTRATLG